MIFFVMRAGTAQEVTNAYARIQALEELLFQAMQHMPGGTGAGRWLKGRECVERAHEELAQLVRDLQKRAA